MDYKSSGVDVEAGYRSVELIKEKVRGTFRKEVIGDIGGFGGLFSIAAAKEMDEPVLVSGTDGVGTKLKLAFLMDRHDTIGIDCVAMCVNDIVCCGAEPLFFLDYIACGKNYPEKIARIVEGVSKGCNMAGASLIGGETAEMPGFYPEDEYDLAGFSVGIVDKKNMINGSEIKENDVLIGIASNGLHSNGYSLVRKILNPAADTVDIYMDELGATIGEELLKPTRIYVKTILELKKSINIKGISNITGGGFVENIPRMIPKGLKAKIFLNTCNNQKAYALERAVKSGIDATFIGKKQYSSIDDYEDALIRHFKEKKVGLVVLAGFMVILGEKFIKEFRGRILNIHPSLIPSFCGEGMYGLRVHEAALQKGVKITGATVHYVDEGTDTGAIVMQKSVPVLDTDTPLTLQKRGKENLSMRLKLLIVGGGGREHAIIAKLLKSEKELEIYCAPGNGGISELAECVDIKATDIKGLLRFAKEKAIDYTIVGMDDPLVLGIVNEFEKEGLKIFGPRKEAAAIEGSKAFSKRLMEKYNIPTAEYKIFDDYNEALSYMDNIEFPAVIKADGLALGKGVLICDNFSQAEAALKSMMVDGKFGDAGKKIVIEQFLTGHEVSILSFCDGKTIVPCVSAQDHKRAMDGDKGLNTGGMGAFSPSKYYTEEIAKECMETILRPTVDALIKENREFKGIIFFGLMLTPNGPKVIEYNARFGDPETQVILPRLKTDLLDIMMACTNGTLDEINIEWDDNAAACVIIASGGYPEEYEKGYKIEGLERIKKEKALYVYHAGTTMKDKEYITNGGRVLGVTGTGGKMSEAVSKAYEGVEMICFKDMHYRTDIGIR
ncbi:trifunctional purine biosynthetic protein adenosine-3-related [Holotrichia oblita]|uniref:Trifunctional purine biosynthetic protein adenosine-3-related n=1 Tax=Holotrichia oblita TaxID=644536 RepID=A0ACB9TBG3_HOLOL|nr:trifunctional purine biosynthetic protein adenosine-3-related [Holotrichia oblita]